MTESTRKCPSVDAFSLNFALMQEQWALKPYHLEQFVELWSEYDDGSGCILPKDLEAMLLRYAMDWMHC